MTNLAESLPSLTRQTNHIKQGEDTSSLDIDKHGDYGPAASVPSLRPHRYLHQYDEIEPLVVGDIRT